MAISTVDQSVIDSIVTEVTSVLTNGGTMDISITVEGFSATVVVHSTVSPDVPVLSAVK